MRFYLYAAAVLMIAAGVFAIQNSEAVIDVKFIQWTFTGPAISVLAVTFASGFFAGMFFFVPSWFKKASQARSSGKRVQQLESELEKVPRYATAEQPEEASMGPGADN